MGYIRIPEEGFYTFGCIDTTHENFDPEPSNAISLFLIALIRFKWNLLVG